MGLIRFLFWTGGGVMLGIFLATFRVGGSTPLELGQRAWRHEVTPARVHHLGSAVEGVYQDARRHLATPDGPTERHSARDRAAMDALIAKRASPKR